MLFLGNSASLHMAVWRRLYFKAGILVESFYSIHEIEAGFKVEQYSSLKKIFFINKIISYVLLGIYLLIRGKGTIHAHGASGYGLSAFLSCNKYIVTVYGSEIFGKHSSLYGFLIKCILFRAKAITVTSLEAKKRVAEIIGENDKTYLFHTGLNLEFVDNYKKEIDAEKFIVTSVRNSAKHYRTETVIKAFIDFSSNHSGVDIQLNVILGNGDDGYFDELKSRFKEYNVNFIDGRLDYEKMLTLISDSTVCVSYPISDQLSSTLLECIYMNRCVLSSKLDSYLELKKDISDDSFVLCESDAELVDALELCFKTRNKSREIQIRDSEFIKSKFSEDLALKPLVALIDYVEGL
ncbi:hypothetical protein DC364_20180 [Vibrio vulnificus]|uniref:glycosyltransferase n=1 Tax=Vibrio vulnificus TaxID=672 RepID=UPI000D3E6C6D|nr:glycosyltransferase [Vibrio vulnificus]PUZ91969.1 hypothetical protein DC364_20180 [Vibrio vulnificus]HAS6040073.1 glycosyltransferase [Vibrio vulnificus]HAS6119840.1 glycosyltransferase [Vibrio vulnificus]